mmetsp:Transcript_57629/g.66543  ORF Transcript_57629/g.66543 Transcript_57629/m.66543 type:complete len:260 (-) Transcript_57629:151-930(-)
MKFIISALSFFTIGVATAAAGSFTSEKIDGVDAELSEVFLRGGTSTTSSTTTTNRRLGMFSSDSFSSDENDDIAQSDESVESVESSSSSAGVTSTTSAESTSCTSIIDTVCTMEDTTVFCDILKNSTTDIPELDDSSDEFTLFVPTDQAFGLVAATIETLSEDEAGRVIAFHIYQGIKLSTNELVCGEKLTSMTTENDQSRTKCQLGGYKYQVGNGNTKHGSLPQILSADTPACNGVVHTLDHVMYPVSLRQLEEGGRQ